MSYIKKYTGLFILVFSVFEAFALDSSRVKLSGWGFLTYGKIVSSQRQIGIKDFDFDGENYADFDAGLKATFNLGKYGKGRFGFGLSTAYMMSDPSSENVELRRRRTAVYITDAALEYTFKNENHTFFTEFGYLPVKYNPQAMNLGEYLFRSNCYPNVVVSGFELADKEKLVGIHGMYRNDFSDNSWFKADLYNNVEMNYYPQFNLSLSYIVTANIAKFFEFGLGLSHMHFVYFDEDKITPGNSETNQTKKETDEWKKYAHYTDSTDTAVYTFRGTKAMGRVTLDPKAFFDAPIFGSEDLKFYGELAILGLKNYDYWYEDIFERMPIMLGFNVPTFKILDVLSVEVQYWKNPYWNTTENMWKNRSPVPYIGFQIPYYEQKADSGRTNDDWRWSIYASKKIRNRVKISLQFASDNIARTAWMPPPPSYTRYTEVLPRTKDWYWVGRCAFFF